MGWGEQHDPIPFAVDVKRVRFKPGDTAVLTYRDGQQVDHDTAKRIREQWQRIFPGVPVIILSNLELSVVEKEEHK